MCLAQGHNTVTLVRLKPATRQSDVKHSTTFVIVGRLFIQLPESDILLHILLKTSLQCVLGCCFFPNKRDCLVCPVTHAGNIKHLQNSWSARCRQIWLFSADKNWQIEYHSGIFTKHYILHTG